MSNVVETTKDRIRIIQLDHDSKQNPFSEELENSIKTALNNAQNDDSVDAVVVYGGEGRSFSAGGDFNEVKSLAGGDEVDRWIDRVFDLYTAVLEVDKPTVAAIDGYAIGMGFQFAMMFDWGVMSSNAKFVMPELKHGIGCSVGAAILTALSTYKTTQEIIYGCDVITPDKAIKHSMVNEVIPPELVLSRAFDAACRLRDYPVVAFRNTKRSLNKKLIARLDSAIEESKLVHRAAFADRSVQKHFKNILGEDKYNKEPAVTE